MALVTLASATAATALLAGSASRLAIAGWARLSTQLRTRRLRVQLQSDLQQQATRARMAGQAYWQSTQDTRATWQVMQVVEVVDESDDVRSFYLQDPLQTSPLPSYRAGQFLIVRPALGGVDLPARCYSLSDASGQNWYRISIKRQTHSSQQPHSLSNWLHDHIQTGDCLLVTGPHGEFVIDDCIAADAPIALLAAGVGITPIMSMLKSLLQSNPNRAIHVIYQVQDEAHWPFGELIHSWAAKCPALKVVSYFSRLTSDNLPEVNSGSVQPGKADPQTVFSALSEPKVAHYYMCGPNAWMQAMQSSLMGLGVPAEQLHWESFATEPAEDHQAAVDEWTLQFVRSGISVPASNEPATILQAASQQGLSLPAACHQGVCGSCKLKLLKGSVKYSRRPTCHHADNEVVACIAQAVGAVEVDA